MDKDDIVRKSADLLEKSVKKIAESQASKNKTTVRQATVSRIDTDGTVWVHIPGGANETPADTTVASVAPGDNVIVLISDGRCRVMGNSTKPSTDDSAARKVSADTDAAIQSMGNGISASASADIKKMGNRLTNILNKHQETMDEAQKNIDKVNAELMATTKTADGRNRVFVSSSEPTPKSYTTNQKEDGSYETVEESGGFVQGDTWYVVGSMDIPTEFDDDGNVTKTKSITGATDVKVWDGTKWNDLRLVADSVVVPSSVGPTIIQDGAVQTNHMVANSIDAKVLDVDSITGSSALFGKIEALFANLAGTVFENGTMHSSGQTKDGKGIGFYSDSDGNYYIGNQTYYLKFDASTGKIVANMDTISIDGNEVPVIDKVEYAKSKTTGVPSSGWMSDPIDSEEGYYIWTRTTYSTGLIVYSCSYTGSDGKDGEDGQNGKDGKDGQNGKDGKDGQNGNDGSSITISGVRYGTSSSGTNEPSSWQSTLPTVEQGHYLWTRIYYSDGTHADTVMRQPENGKDGTDVTSQYILYNKTGTYAGLNLVGVTGLAGPRVNLANTAVSVCYGTTILSQMSSSSIDFYSDGTKSAQISANGVYCPKANYVNFGCQYGGLNFATDGTWSLGRAFDCQINCYGDTSTHALTVSTWDSYYEYPCMEFIPLSWSSSGYENRRPIYFECNSAGGILLDSANTYELDSKSNKHFDTLFRVSNGIKEVNFGIGAGGYNRGIYDRSTGAWISYADSSGTFHHPTSSSRLIKEHFEDFPDEEIDDLLSLKVWKYDYKDGHGDKDRRGLIAEDVQKVFPKLVTNSREDGDPSGLSIDYDQFVPYLIRCLQIQNKRIEDLEGKIK